MVYDFIVAWGECDPAGIVFYPTYFKWADFGMHKLMDGAGVGQRVQGPKFGMVGASLVSATCDFRRPVTFGDRIDHRVKVVEWTERSFRVEHTFTSSGELAAQAHEIRVCLARDAAGRVSSLAIPQDFRNGIESYEATADDR